MAADWKPSGGGDESYWRFCANWRVRIKDRFIHPYVGELWPGYLQVEGMSAGELKGLREERIADLLRHAIEHVPYYARWAKEAGFSTGKLPQLADMPIVTKNEFRAEPEAFQSAAFPESEMGPGKTSGSSGEPFKFKQHKIKTDHSYCCLWRSLRRHGLRPGMRRVYAWGRAYRFNATAEEIKKTARKQKVRNWLNNTLGINAYDLTDKNVGAAVELIEEFRPVYMHGYVSALYQIARYLEQTGKSFKSFQLKAAVTESEKLYDFQRATMEKAFGCKVLEHYGSVEMGNIAAVDPDGLMRVNDDAYAVETLPSGKAVITSLFSHSYPFIRYTLGDLVEVGESPNAKLPYSVITKITGRTVDMIPVASGGYVHGVALAHVIDPHLKYVTKYQIHQTAVDRFDVKLIAGEKLPAEVPDRVARDLRSLVGESATINVVQVEEIAPAASGKFRWVMSDVSDVAAKALEESGG